MVTLYQDIVSDWSLTLLTHPYIMNNFTEVIKSKSTTRSQPMVQGHALLFRSASTINKSEIQLHQMMVTDRNLTLGECLGCYLQNTNLYNLPLNCLGVLVDFRANATTKATCSLWNLGVLLYLHKHGGHLSMYTNFG